MKKGIFKIALISAVASVSVAGALIAHEKQQEKISDILCADEVEALGQSESGSGSLTGKSINNITECIVKEYIVCETGGSITINGITIGCSFDRVVEVEYPGTQNLCIYTGRSGDYCNFYTCRKNG